MQIEWVLELPTSMELLMALGAILSMIESSNILSAFKLVYATESPTSLQEKDKPSWKMKRSDCVGFAQGMVHTCRIMGRCRSWQDTHCVFWHESREHAPWYYNLCCSHSFFGKRRRLESVSVQQACFIKKALMNNWEPNPFDVLWYLIYTCAIERVVHLNYILHDPYSQTLTPACLLDQESCKGLDEYGKLCCVKICFHSRKLLNSTKMKRQTSYVTRLGPILHTEEQQTLTRGIYLIARFAICEPW